MTETTKIIQWSEKYLIGHNRIDQDHQFLFHLLHEAGSAKPADDSFYFEHHLLNKLLDFAHIHFMDEEALMRNICFSDYGRHSACHSLLLQKTEDLLARVKLGYALILPDIVGHLREWIVFDILNEDAALGLALAGR